MQQDNRESLTANFQFDLESLCGAKLSGLLLAGSCSVAVGEKNALACFWLMNRISVALHIIKLLEPVDKAIIIRER